MQLITFPITLVESFMISPKVKHFIFRCEQTPVFDYLPGQFITIHFDKDGKTLKRSYSLANPPAQDNRIEFAAGYVEGGPGTDLLFNLKVGEQVQINGPFGRLIYKDTDPGRYILVATSTGVTPYRAMLPSLQDKLRQNPALRVVILQGVQKQDEILYQQEFVEFAAANPAQVIFYPYLSREEAATLLPHQRQGYVQHAFPTLNLNPTEDLVYLCGNPAMIDDAFEYLKAHGFAMQQIIREKYISR